MEEINNTDITNQVLDTQPIIETPISTNSKPNNIFKILFFITFVVLIGVVIIGLFLINKKTIKEEQPTNNISNTEIKTELENTPTGMDLNPTEEEKIEESTIVIKGKVCYPSDFIPDGNILAKNIQTNKIESFPFTYESKNQNFSISLKEGNYIFAYESKNDKTKGYYSKCALTTQNSDCSTSESHKPIVVNVKSNTTIENIILCDYYYGQGEEPNF